MLNIVVPMAGLGSRFARAGYCEPKPLIPIFGKPMIQVVIENLRPKRAHTFIFICQRSHCDKYNLYQQLRSWAPNSIIVAMDGVTDGAACTVLKAKELIDSDADPLMIANCDQYIAANIDSYLDNLRCDLDGLIMTMKAHGPKWSYIDVKDQLISTIVEKTPISDEATVGIYNFTKGSDFVSAAEEMVAADDRVNNEFYVAPTYNYLIRKAKRIGFKNMGCLGAGVFSLGTPEDLEASIASGVIATAR